MIIQILQLLLSITILVFFHELGHFTAAKLFKTKVEKFYLFFNPWFSLFKIKKGETEYGIGWIPLGGYVKIAGMIDESMDKEQMKKPPQPWEFRAKKPWQRLIILLAGIFVNILMAVVIYISILNVWGDPYLPVQEVNKYGIIADSLGQSFGLQDGDKIISVNGKKEKKFTDVYTNLLLNEPHELQIERNNEIKTIKISNSDIAQIIEHGSFFSPGIPFIVGGFTDSSAAQKAGLRKGDKIVEINGNKVELFNEIKPIIEKNKNKQITVKVDRNGQILNFAINVPSSGLIGVKVETDLNKLYNIDTQKYSLIQAIPAGIKKTYSEVKSYWKQIELVFTPETKAYKSVGSFITISKLFPKEWNWEVFWRMTALLSIMLAVINILPIPGLDGGHAMFVIYEMVTGRKPSDKFMEYAQIVGMIIILILIFYALGNDIVRNIL